MVSDPVVKSAWDGGSVPTFPSYHGRVFYENNVEAEKKSDSSVAAFRFVDNESQQNLGFDPPQGNSLSQQSMSRPLEPLLTGSGQRHKMSSNKNGTNVNIVAPDFVNHPPGHASIVSKCVMKDGDEQCEERATQDEENSWTKPGDVLGINLKQRYPADALPGHGAVGKT